MYTIKEIKDHRLIYDYCLKLSDTVPYMHRVPYNIWLESFTADTDTEGDKMFSLLITEGAFIGETLVGFVQYGISRYIYNEQGEKDYSICGFVIRSLYFDAEHDCGDMLIRAAEKYSMQNQGKYSPDRKYAFFHALGMSCYNGHGKLFSGLTHIEKALTDQGYITEHENVYYKRILDENVCIKENDITVKYEKITSKGVCGFSLFHKDIFTGAGELVYLPFGNICFLRWIYIDGNYQGKGYGTAALKRLFCDLYSQGIRRIDTDTADGNIIAQRLYTKTGFTYMGRTRSYFKEAII